MHKVFPPSSLSPVPLLTITHEGQTFTEEEAKAGIIHGDYNDLLGKLFSRTHRMDLSLLNLPTPDLKDQARPFTAEEIAAAVHDTPSDRAPGPDGFTTAFFKSSWEIISDDFLAAFRSLWALDFRGFHDLNTATMVLLQKRQAPQGLRDYRPISLIHSVGKLFAKTLALRLAPRMMELIRGNQTAFIRGRRIHDSFRTVQLACRFLHSSKFPVVLLKIDLAKAFDTVAWPFLLEVMEHMGFLSRWREWVSAMLRSARTRVLVNGCLGMRICHARGLRQGDPLSPLLFVIVMEVLNALIHEVGRLGHLTPLPSAVAHYRVSVYADDLVILLAPADHDLAAIRQVLELFAGASGLMTNIDKCTMTPIACSTEDL